MEQFGLVHSPQFCRQMGNRPEVDYEIIECWKEIAAAFETADDAILLWGISCSKRFFSLRGMARETQHEQIVRVHLLSPRSIRSV